jgi:hypothetical protein
VKPGVEEFLDIYDEHKSLILNLALEMLLVMSYSQRMA